MCLKSLYLLEKEKKQRNERKNQRCYIIEQQK